MDFSLDAGIPILIKPLLQEYISRLKQDAQGLVSAFYLVRSVRLEAFNPHLSDIDFVAVLSRPASAGDIEKLPEIHQTVESQYPTCNHSKEAVNL